MATASAPAPAPLAADAAAAAPAPAPSASPSPSPLPAWRLVGVTAALLPQIALMEEQSYAPDEVGPTAAAAVAAAVAAAISGSAWERQRRAAGRRAHPSLRLSAFLPLLRPFLFDSVCFSSLFSAVADVHAGEFSISPRPRAAVLQGSSGR